MREMGSCRKGERNVERDTVSTERGEECGKGHSIDRMRLLEPFPREPSAESFKVSGGGGEEEKEAMRQPRSTVLVLSSIKQHLRMAL